MTKSEVRFLVIVIVAILVVTGLPYIYGYLSAPAAKQFMGLTLNVPDHVQYFSWMRELSQAPLSADKMTPEPNQAIFFNLLWWGLGRLQRLLGSSYALIYQLLRVGAGITFLLAAYRLCARYLADLRARRVAFLVIALGAGLGWALVVLKYTLAKGELLFPLDLYVSESNTFLSIMSSPHFAAAALYILVFDLVLLGESKRQLRYAVWAGLLALFLGWQHAYDLSSVYFVLAVYVLLRWLRDRKLPVFLIYTCLITGVISVWPALYSFLLTSLDPVWEQVLAQFSNAGVYTPGLLHLPVLLGIAFMLALLAVIRDNPLKLRGLSDDDLFLRGWFLAYFVLVYLPVDFQIHLLNGWQVPIAILAVQGVWRYGVPMIQRVGARWRRSWSPQALQRVLGVALVLVVLPTNLYLWLWRFVDLRRHDYPYYLYRSEVAAMSWLEDQAMPEDVVLSSLTTGQYIPALCGTHAFLAHWAQTLDFYGKTDMVAEFYAADTSEVRREQILQRYSVDYVFYGPAERALGAFDPSRSGLLQRVFVDAETEVYAVKS